MRRSTLALALTSILTLGITAAAPAHAERAGRAVTVLGKTWCLGAPDGVRCDVHFPMAPAPGPAAIATAQPATAQPATAAPKALTASPPAAVATTPSVAAPPDSIVGRWLALARERAAAAR